MTVKDMALETIQHLSDDCSMEEFIDGLRLRDSLEQMRVRSQSGERIALQEVEDRFLDWVKQFSK
ncbi:MAG: hypothetical protein AAF558_12770 [Verrucomicrobiota bacterium]